MIALRLVQLIEDHSEELAEGLTKKLLSSESTRDLQRLPAHELHERCHEIYRHLSEWLLTKTEHDVEVAYKALGARRAGQGISMAGLTWAILLTKGTFMELPRVGGRSRRVAQRVRGTRAIAPAGTILRSRRVLRDRRIRGSDQHTGSVNFSRQASVVSRQEKHNAGRWLVAEG